MRIVDGWVAVVFVVVAGCHIQQRDGGPCTQKSDCKSGICTSGYCEGSGCSCSGDSDCTSRDCDEGWLCKYYAPDPVTGWFGNPGSHRCVPLCGACPPDYTCATPSSPGSACTYTPPMLTVDAGGPYSGAPGQPIAFHATASSPVAAIVSYTWQFGDGQMAGGADVTHVYDGPFSGVVTVEVTDANADTGSATAPVDVCGFAGARCFGGQAQCCAGTTCDPTTYTCQ